MKEFVPVTPGGTILTELAAATKKGAIKNLLKAAAHMPYDGWPEFKQRGYSIEILEHYPDDEPQEVPEKLITDQQIVSVQGALEEAAYRIDRTLKGSYIHPGEVSVRNSIITVKRDMERLVTDLDFITYISYGQSFRRRNPKTDELQKIGVRWRVTA